MSHHFWSKFNLQDCEFVIRCIDRILKLHYIAPFSILFHYLFPFYLLFKIFRTAVRRMAFSPSEFRSFQLEKIERINHNVSLFRFKLPGSSDVAGLPVASCVIFRSNITKDGKTEEVIRPYTPTSLETAEGHVDFVIKDYPKGNMSRHVHSMKVGDTIDIKGPFQKYNWQSKPVEYVGMVAGNLCFIYERQLAYVLIFYRWYWYHTHGNFLLLKGNDIILISN